MSDDYLIARCRPNFEARATKQIARDQGEASYPQVKRKILSKNRREVTIKRPLINGYLFVKKKPQKEILARDWRYLIVDGKIAKIAQTEVSRLDDICTDLDKFENLPTKPRYKRGQRVRMISGLMGRAEETGRFCGYLRNGKRARVLINGVMFTLKSERLEAAAPE